MLGPEINGKGQGALDALNLPLRLEKLQMDPCPRKDD